MLYTHDLRNSMNERTHFFIKIYLSLFILERVDVSVVCERWVERHILRERTSSSHIFFQEPGGANACTLLQARQKQPDRLLVPRSAAILCTLSKSARVVLITVTHLFDLSALIVLSILLITSWQLVKAHRVTRNEPKIHCICYITIRPPHQKECYEYNIKLHLMTSLLFWRMAERGVPLHYYYSQI